MSTRIPISEKFHTIPNNNSLVLLLRKSEKWESNSFVARLDKKTNGQLFKATETYKGDIITAFSGQLDNVERTIVLVNVEYNKIDSRSLPILGAKLFEHLEKISIQTWTLINDTGINTDLPYQVLLGFDSKSHINTKYFSTLSTKPVLTLYQENHDILNTEKYHALSEGIRCTKQLISTPSNDKVPKMYADLIKAELSGLNIQITVLEKERLKQLGMGCLLGVSSGSAADPVVMVLELNAESDTAPIALLGKGVTFDSGGICIKPSSRMSEMKADMGGSAAIVGAMKALALSKSNAHVIGVLGLVENMPSGTAYRPGDVLISFSKKSVEIGDTDAEGRLVLADLISYAQDELKATEIIDIATLTGAIRAALGGTRAGLFSNNSELTSNLCKAGIRAGEYLHAFDIDAEFVDALKSPIADICNIAKPGTGGGAISAAAFLRSFVKEGVQWAHIDIAGVAWNSNNQLSTNGGAVGYGVKLLYEYCNRAAMSYLDKI